MQAPSQSLRPISPPPSVTSRAGSIVLAVILNLGIIYALVTGLASSAVKLIVQNIDVAVIKEPPPDESKPPPPPPPQMKEPPPFVPPPDINIDITEAAPAPTAITNVQTTVPVVAAPVPVTSPAKPINSHAVTDRDYPPISIRLNEEGRVTVKFVVDAEGNVSDVQVIGPSGKERLDNAAIALVKRWRYHPALQAGKPVPTTISAVVVFRLH
jgi:periplasmic protein TonB